MTTKARGTVLVILHEESAGGASLAVLRLIPLLESMGWHLAFWATKPSALHDELVERGCEVGGAWRPLVYSARGLRRAPGPVRRIRRARPYLRSLREFAVSCGADLIHANTLLTTWEALMLRRSCGLPVVLQVHEMLPRGPKGRLAARLARASADVFAADSRACAARLAERGIGARVVYCAAPSFARAPTQRRDGPTVVGTVGTVSRRKGSDLFVQAAELIRAESPELRFEMVGSTAEPFESDWAQGILERAAGARVEHREGADIESLLPTWDIFVLPSREDPFPIAILEAMATGLPVVACAVDGIVEQITPTTGVLVPREDSHALARAIRDLAASSERRRALGDAGATRVATEFTLDRQAKGLSQAYAEALSVGRDSR